MARNGTWPGSTHLEIAGRCSSKQGSSMRLHRTRSRKRSVLFGGHTQGPPSSKVALSIPGPSIAYPMEITQHQQRSLGDAFSVLISCLLFGRETHASTTQSDPLLLPTRNGPCREDGAPLWEYLFSRVQHPPP